MFFNLHNVGLVEQRVCTDINEAWAIKKMGKDVDQYIQRGGAQDVTMLCPFFTVIGRWQ